MSDIKPTHNESGPSAGQYQRGCRCAGCRAAHAEKARVRRSRWSDEKRAEIARKQREHQARQTSDERLRQGLSRYGIGLAEYRQMLESQGGVCAICGNSPYASVRNLSVDHDHSCCAGNRSCGKCVRGLLCLRCNNAIGLLRDSPEVVQSAVDYLVQRKLGV